MYQIPLMDGLKIDKSGSIYNADDVKYYFNGNDLYAIILKENKLSIVKVKNILMATFYGLIDLRIKFKDKNHENLNLSNLKFKYKNINKYKDGFYIDNEYFKYIPVCEYNIYKNRFGCSDKGVIFDSKHNIFRRHSIDKDGYHRITIDRSHTNVAIHRLVYITWKGNIPKGFAIHHKDNNKWNNLKCNLEAITPELNTRYSILDKCKADCIWNESDIKLMCELMHHKKSFKEIASKFNIDFKSKEYKNLRNTLRCIRNRKIWKDISEPYNFDGYDEVNPYNKRKLNDEKVFEILKLFDSGKNINEICNEYNIGRSTADSIRSGTSWKNIFKKYMKLKTNTK